MTVSTFDRIPPTCPLHPLYAVDQFGCIACLMEASEEESVYDGPIDSRLLDDHGNGD